MDIFDLTDSISQFVDKLKDAIKPHQLNQLNFPEIGQYEFDTNQLETLEQIKTTARHIVTRYLHKPTNLEFVVKSFRIPSRRYGDEAKDAEDEKENFLREIKLFKRLFPNPYIVQFYGISVVDYDAYICMESMQLSLLDLYSLVHERGNVFPKNILAFIAISMVNALSWCQKKKIIHRDVKPGNILINKFGEIKLGDFGESKNTDADTASTVVGTMVYWPPEKFKHIENYDSRTDVWSLGITLLESLYGNIPYTDENDVVPKNFLTLQLCIQSTIETDINKIIDKCLRRYKSKKIREFICSCLITEYDRRPTYADLQSQSLYKKYNPVVKSEMDESVANFISNFKDRWPSKSVLNKNNTKNRESPDYISSSSYETTKTPSSESQDMENRYKKRVLELEQQVLNLKNENEAITMELNNVVEEENKTSIANERNSMDIQSSSYGLIANKIPRQDASYTRKKQRRKFQLLPKPIAETDSYKSLLNNPYINQLEFPGKNIYNFNMEDFTFIETVGSFSNSIVRSYKHKPSEQVLAIKSVLIPYNRNTSEEEKEKSLKHIKREIDNAFKLCHVENIVHYYGFCLYDEQILFCMELMDLSLKDAYSYIHKEHGQFSEGLLGCIAVSVVNALIECHNMHIIHRNIKPSNVLLKKPNIIKVGDFSESSIKENFLSLTFGGNISYMAPETFDIDKCKLEPEKRDVWGLGITLLESALGRIPYHFENEKLRDNIVFVQKVILESDLQKEVEKAALTFQYSTKCCEFVKKCLSQVDDRPMFYSLKETEFYQNYCAANFAPIFESVNIFNIMLEQESRE